MVIVRNKYYKKSITRKIIEKLRAGEKILHKKDIVGVIKEYQRVYKKKVNLVSLWTYLRKDNYIKRILSDYYYVYPLEERYSHYCGFSEEEMVFLVLEKMKIKWYLGLERALAENKVSWQALNVVPIINSWFSGIKTFGNSKFKFIKTKKERFNFGLIKKKTNNGVEYSYSDLERTFLDFLYFYSYEGKDPESVKKSLDFKVRKKRLLRYAKRYPKKIQEAV